VCHGQAECVDNAAAEKSGATRAEKLRGGGCGRARYARGAGGGGAACGGGDAEREDGGDAGALQGARDGTLSSTFLFAVNFLPEVTSLPVAAQC
jgi:hypothetical protein